MARPVFAICELERRRECAAEYGFGIRHWRPERGDESEEHKEEKEKHRDGEGCCGRSEGMGGRDRSCDGTLARRERKEVRLSGILGPPGE